MTIALTLLLGVLVVLAITAATGYFVAQEFAYMAVDRSRLKARAEAGDAVAARTLRVTGRTSFMLSGAQLGITITGLLVGYVAEPMIGQAFGAMLGGVGVPAAAGIAIGTILALLFATFVQMLFGELFPKNLAIARPEPVARWLSRSTLLYLKAFGWLIWFFDHASNVLLKSLGIQPVHDVEHSATAKDLEHIVKNSKDTGDLAPELSVLLDRILDFPTRNVSHAMKPRAMVDVVHPDDTVGELCALMATGHSRYPVVSSDGERLTGVVHLHDVLMATDRSVTAASIQQPILVVSETMSLPNAVSELSRTQNELACVIDEYGGFSGVLTLEDLSEELVGEITDEYDDAVPTTIAATVDEDGVLVVSGDVHVDEIERALECELPSGRYETIAGLVIDRAGDLPPVGATFEIRLDPTAVDLVHDGEPPARSLHVEILGVTRYVPSLLRVTLLETAATKEIAS